MDWEGRSKCLHATSGLACRSLSGKKRGHYGAETVRPVGRIGELGGQKLLFRLCATDEGGCNELSLRCNSPSGSREEGKRKCGGTFTDSSVGGLLEASLTYIECKYATSHPMS